MGLLDRVKDVTGVGLNADEQYQRAYEKGVFLQPPDYGSAAKHFHTAAEKYAKEGNAARALKASVNSALYTMLHAPNASQIRTLIAALTQVEEIEQVRSRDMVPTAPLVAELQAIEMELQAEAANDLVTKSSAFRKAGEHTAKINSGTLVFSDLLKVNGPTAKPDSRRSYYEGLAYYHGAFASLVTSPEDAEDGLMTALHSFKAAEATRWVETTDAHIDSIKTKRHCWICHREMQGRDHYFTYYPARVMPYHRKMVEHLKEDEGMLERAGAVTLCSVCGTAVENQADRYATARADAVRDWVAPILETHRQTIMSLEARVKRLEDSASSSR